MTREIMHSKIAQCNFNEITFKLPKSFHINFNLIHCLFSYWDLSIMRGLMNRHQIYGERGGGGAGSLFRNQKKVYLMTVLIYHDNMLLK